MIYMYDILVVEDEKEIADALEVYLRNQNYNVFKANDGTMPPTMTSTPPPTA